MNQHEREVFTYWLITYGMSDISGEVWDADTLLDTMYGSPNVGCLTNHHNNNYVVLNNVNDPDWRVRLTEKCVQELNNVP